MGTFGSIESLITSLRAQSLAQQLVGHNIANATTPGYSRRLPLLREIAPAGMAGVGSGVRFTGIQRIRDEFLDLQSRFERAVLGEREAWREAVAAARLAFPELNATPGAGVATALTAFFADWSAVAASPGSAAARQALLTGAGTLVTAFRDAHLSLRESQRVTDVKVRSALEEINGLLGRIAKANEDVLRGGDAGRVAAADDRDRALEALSRLLRIDTVTLGDGTVLVLTGNARTLVRGGRASELAAVADAHEPSFAGIGLREQPAGPVTAITGEIRGGRVRGLLDARDGLLADQLLELDQLAHSLASQVNLIHAGGYALDGVTTGTAFFTVLPGVGAGTLSVNAAVAGNPGLLAASAVYGAPANGEQAATLAALENLLMNAGIGSLPPVNSAPGFNAIDPTQPMNSAVPTGLNLSGTPNSANFAVAPMAAGTIVINGVPIAWTDGQSLDQIVATINATFGTAVRAFFDYTSQRFHLLSDAPLTAYDQIGNLTQALNLQTLVRPLAILNAGIGPGDRPISLATPLNQLTDRFRTVPSPNGVLEVRWQAPTGVTRVTSVAWDASQTLGAIRAAINAQLTADAIALGLPSAPFTISASVFALEQILTVEGTTTLPGSAAYPSGPVEFRDATGNLAFALNLEAQPSFGRFRDALLAQMQSQIDAADAALAMSEDAVAQIALQQDAIAKVNVDEEKARLLEYLRAYEASVRAIAAMDEALNTLINRMAASNFAGGSTQSVLSN